MMVVLVALYILGIGVAFGFLLNERPAYRGHHPVPFSMFLLVPTLWPALAIGVGALMATAMIVLTWRRLMEAE